MFLNDLLTWIKEKAKYLLLIRGKLLLYLFLIVVPFITYPFSINGVTIYPRKIREVCFYSFAIIICSFLQKSRWLRYFVIWCVFNWWFNFFIPQESYIILTNIFSALVIYIGVKELLKIKLIKVDILLKIICVMSLFQCIWVVIQIFNFDPVFYPVNSIGQHCSIKLPLCGWSGNPALLATFLACFSFLFLEYFRIKNIPLFFFLILIYILFLKNATSVIALFAGGLFYIFNKYSLKRKYILSILSIIVAVFFLVYIKHPNLDRLPIWGKLISDGIRVRPLLGSGLSIFSHLTIIDKSGTPWFEAHNDYLQMILELGSVGFMLFLGFVISRFVMFLKLKRRHKQVCIASCLVSYLVSGISLFPMHIVQLSFYAIILLAILEHTYYEIELSQNK